MSGPGVTYYRIDGGLALLYTGPTLMDEGDHAVEYWSEDAVGNPETPVPAFYRSDRTPPASTVSGAPAWWTNADVDVTLAGSDALSGLAGIRYRLDGGETETYTAPIHLSLEATYVLDSWAVDVSGLAEATQTTTIRIDKTLPSTLSDYDGGWRDGPVLVTLTATDPASGSGIVDETTYRVGSEATATYGTPFLVSAEGTTPVVFTSRDAGGNQEPPRTIAVRVDTLAPHTQLSKPPLEGGGGTAISLETSDAGSGVAAMRYRVGAGPVRPYTASTCSIIVTATGETTVEFWSVDRVGNVEDTESVTVSRGGVGSTGHGGNVACLTCHDAVRGIVPARVDYAVPDVDLTKCGSCHWIGVHPGHASDSDCTACHRTFPTRDAFYSPKVATAYGNFTSAGSTALPAATIHQIHANGSWPQSAIPEPAVCASCHMPAACDACHTSVSHREHAYAAQPATYAPVTYQAAYGTPVDDVNGDYTAPYTATCASFSCHDMDAARVSTARVVSEEIGPGVTRTGTWTLGAKTNSSGGYTLSSALAGSSLTYTVAGPGEVRLFGSKHSRGGIVAISLDGATPVEVDTYSVMTTNRDLLFSAAVGPGTHTITATVTGRLNAPSLGATIILDAVHVVTTAASVKDFVPGCEGCHADKAGTHGYGAMDHVADETATVAPGLGGTACGVCHAMELMEEHAKSTSSSVGRACVNCHPAPRRSFDGWQQTCEQGGCHATGGPEERHLRLPAVHVVSTGGKASCSRNCHDADIVAEHARKSVTCEDCHTSAKFAAVFDTPAGWNGTCQACHTTGLKHGTSSGNGWCVTCHGTSDTTMTAVAGASAYGATAGDHETGYAGSAHAAVNVPAGANGGVDTDTQCDACHNHAAVREGVTTDYRVDGGSAGQDEREGLCFRCHSASGDETRSPGARPYTWNGRDVAAEFARASSHPLTVSTPTAASEAETVTAFVQSVAPEFDTDTKFQLGSVSTSGAVLAWDSYPLGGGVRDLLFYLPNRIAVGDRPFSQYDGGLPLSFGWNISGFDPANVGGVPSIQYGGSAVVVDNTFVWSLGQGYDTRYRYTPPADGASGPGTWSSAITTLPFTPGYHIDAAADDHGYVYYLGAAGNTVHKWRSADDTWTAPMQAISGGALPIQSSSSLAYSPETGRLYLAMKNWGSNGKVYYAGSPWEASGTVAFTNTGLSLDDTWGGGNADPDVVLERFVRNGHDYLFYTGPDSSGFTYLRHSVIGGLASGAHTARRVPDLTWWSNQANPDLAWDGGDYIYILLAGNSVGRIKIPDDPINDAWGAWELLPAPPAMSNDQFSGAIGFLKVNMPGQDVVGYRTLGTLSAEVAAPAGATAWKALAWDKEVPAQTTLRLRVEGWDGSGWQTIPGMGSVVSPTLDLSGLDTATYPRLRLTATFTTLNTNATPRVRAWTVTARREARTPRGVSLSCVSCHNTHLVAKGDGNAWDIARVSNPANTKDAPPARRRTSA